MHVLAVVLRSGEQPGLSRAQMQRVMYAHRAHKEYTKYQDTLSDSDDDEGPQDEEAWLFEDLSILAKLYARLRDREQLIELIFEVRLIAPGAVVPLNDSTLGDHRRPIEGHHHNFLHAACSGLPCCEHCGFS